MKSDVEVESRRVSIKCSNCGNSVYFWRDFGKLMCQICGAPVDFFS